MTPIARMSIPAGGRYPIGYTWQIASNSMSGALASWAFPQPGHYHMVMAGVGGDGGDSSAFEYGGAGAGSHSEIRDPWGIFQVDAAAAFEYRRIAPFPSLAHGVEVRMTGKATVSCWGGAHGGDAGFGIGGDPNGGNPSANGGNGQQMTALTTELMNSWFGRLARGTAGGGGAANGLRGGGGGGYGGMNVPAGVTNDGVSYSSQTSAATPQNAATGAPGGVATGYGAGAPGAGGNYEGNSVGGSGNPGVILIQKVGA